MASNPDDTRTGCLPKSNVQRYCCTRLLGLLPLYAMFMGIFLCKLTGYVYFARLFPLDCMFNCSPPFTFLSLSLLVLTNSSRLTVIYFWSSLAQSCLTSTRAILLIFNFIPLTVLFRRALYCSTHVLEFFNNIQFSKMN